MSDVALVKKMFDKKMYRRISPFIKEYACSVETWEIVKGLGKYFDAYPHRTDVDFAEFKGFFFHVITKSSKPEKHTLLTKFFELLEKETPDSEVVEDVLRNYITKDYATQIMNQSAAVISGTAGSSMDNISDTLSKYNKEVGITVTKDDLFVPISLSYIVRSVTSPGISWRLNELNMSLGPLRKGDFIILAARPETGKTTFVASEVANFLPQIKDEGRPIVWVNNEESSEKVVSRVIQAFHGVTISEMAADQERCENEFIMSGGMLLKVLDDESGINDVPRLTALFEELNPAVIVFDQLDKVAGFTKVDREDLRLGSLYQWARELAKKYGPTIAVSQASEAADHSKYITMGMLRGSKTDKAGEADAIITIGRDVEDNSRRYIHVPKNKLVGGPLSKEEHRHGYFEVDIVPSKARYVGVH